jgi:hypothetical protein
VHLEIAVVIGLIGTVERRIRENAQHLRSAEERPAEGAPTVDLSRIPALDDGILDSRRASRLEHFANDPCRRRTDPGCLSDRAAGFGQVGQRLLEREHGRRGAFVAEHFLRRRLREREIAQQSTDDSVDVRLHVALLVQSLRPGCGRDVGDGIHNANARANVNSYSGGQDAGHEFAARLVRERTAGSVRCGEADH